MIFHWRLGDGLHCVPRMFFKQQVITGLYGIFVSLEQQSVKIAFMKSPSNTWALKDRSLKEKAIIKRKPASYGSDFIMFSCCYFHHRLFYIPHLFFSLWSCILRSHLFRARNDFYDNFPEEWRTRMERELQLDRYRSGRIFLRLETFSPVELGWSIPNQEMPDRRSNRAWRVKK